MKSTTSKSTAGAAKKTATKQNPSDQLMQLLQDELKDIYWAEKALVKALPKMIKNATSEELKTAIEEHLEVTENQVTRLEEVFEILELKPEAKKCEAMAGLIKEADQIMEETEEGIIRDAGIISAAQKVEHYEIATYGTLRTFATTLGLEDVANLFQETLDEEKEADEALTTVAESTVNIETSEK